MAGPSHSLAFDPIQDARSVGLAVVHDSFGHGFWGVNHDTNLISSNVGGKQSPSTIGTDLMYRPQNAFAGTKIQNIWDLEHRTSHAAQPFFVWRSIAAAWHVVVPVGRPGLGAMQVGAIAGESNEVCRGTAHIRSGKIAANFSCSPPSAP